MDWIERDRQQEKEQRRVVTTKIYAELKYIKHQSLEKRMLYTLFVWLMGAGANLYIYTIYF